MASMKTRRSGRGIGAAGATLRTRRDGNARRNREISVLSLVLLQLEEELAVGGLQRLGVLGLLQFGGSGGERLAV